MPRLQQILEARPGAWETVMPGARLALSDQRPRTSSSATTGALSP